MFVFKKGKENNMMSKREFEEFLNNNLEIEELDYLNAKVQGKKRGIQEAKYMLPGTFLRVYDAQTFESYRLNHAITSKGVI